MTTIERIHSNGILRIGTPERGFRYRSANGGKVTQKDLVRIRRLRIPPAWTDVAINPAESGRVQVVGKDDAGRWQYLYHDNHIRQRDRKKFLRVIKFAVALPAMRRAVKRDLRQPGLSRERVLAGIVRILSAAFLRPGSEVYASEHGSYGVATLRPRHVAVKGSTILFRFRGKSGVMHESQLEDRQIARLIRQLLKHPNRRVFKHENGEGTLIDVKAQTINTYIREMKETARALGNTPAVCRSSYICPAVIEAFEKDKTISDYFDSVERLVSYRGTQLHPAEKALLRLLKKETSATG